jgi:hypothetical protein
MQQLLRRLRQHETDSAKAQQAEEDSILDHWDEAKRLVAKPSLEATSNFLKKSK